MMIPAMKRKLDKAQNMWREKGARVTTMFTIHRLLEDRTWVGKLAELAGNKATVDGATFDLNTPHMTTKLKSRFLISSYELEARYLLKKHLPRNLPVIELGSCIGVVSCVTNRLLQRPENHVVVEANHHLLPTLNRNKQNNGCRFKVHNAAIAYGAEEVTFNVDERFNEGTLHKESANKIRVPAISIAEIIRQEGFAKISVICDIEGAEVELFENEGETLQKHVDCLIVEMHNYTPLMTAKAQNALRKIGFQLVEQFEHNYVYRNPGTTHAQPAKPHAVVIGIDHYLGLQTARIFAQRGVPVIGIARNPNHFCCRTNICDEIIHADVLDEALIPALKALGKRLPQKAVLVPCRDMSVLLISRFREALAPYFHFALPDAATVEMLMDKLSFYAYAKKHDLPIPKYHLLRTRADAEDVAQSFTFPCILKPPMKAPKWEANTKEKAFKIADATTFLRTYDMCSAWAEVLMAQEWIEGGDGNNYSCNVFFDARSRPLVTFTAKKIRQWPIETGNTSLGEECRNDVVRDTALELFEAVGFKGLAYLEMKRDERTGRHFIIEPNIGRPTGRSALAEASGVDLLYTMYCDLTGGALPANRTQSYRNVKWIYLRQDLQSAMKYMLRGDLTFLAWLKSIRGPKAYAVLSLSDPMPFLIDFKERIAANVGALFKRTGVFRNVSNEFESPFCAEASGNVTKDSKSAPTKESRHKTLRRGLDQNEAPAIQDNANNL